MGRKKLWTKVLATSILLSGSIFWGGIKAGAIDIGIENQISTLQETENCYEFKDGVLTLRGNVDRDQIVNFAEKSKVNKIVATKGTVLPKWCHGLFDGYGRTKSIDLSMANTSNVTDMSRMFANCSGLIEVDLSNFDTSKVTSMYSMFEFCYDLRKLDLSSLDTSKVTSMSYMFMGCYSLKFLDLSNFITDNVERMTMMFYGCFVMEELNIENFNTSNVESMEGMFAGCSALKSLDVSKFDTSKVTVMNSMFNGCKLLTSLDVSKFDTENVKTMSDMFAGCNALKSLDVSNFITSKVNKMGWMFRECSSLNSLNVSNFDTSCVEDMAGMFQGCSGLTRLDLKNFDTSNVTRMGWVNVNADKNRESGMFKDCSNLEELDLSNFITAKVIDMRYMFSGCSKLRKLNLSNFDTQKANMEDMFANDLLLREIKLGENFKKINIDSKLPNGENRWAKGSEDGSLVSESGEYAVIVNDGLNTYYKVAAPSKGDVSKVFTDMLAGEWYLGAAQFVYDNGIMNGVSETAFGPKIVLTREQFITVLYNMEGAPEIEFKQIFSDVTNDPKAWYAKSVTWASENSITSGIRNNLFGTGQEITREQLATLLYNYAKQKEGYKLDVDESLIANFPDVDQISDWATTGMKWAVTNGVMGGKSGNDGQNILDPKGKATRAECAQMIKNLKEKAVK